MECENELKQLYNSGFKLVNLPRNNLNEYLRIRTKLRCTYERLIIEESNFSLSNSFDNKLWEECYEKPIEWIETHFDQKHKANNLHLRSLRSLFISFLDEGTSLFQLLLRCLPDDKFTFNFTIYMAILLRKRESLNSNVFLEQSYSRAFGLLQEAIMMEPFKGFGYFVMAQWTLKDSDPLLSMYWALTACNVKEPYNSSMEFLKNLARNMVTSPSFLNGSKQSDLLNCQLLQMAAHALLSLMTGHSHLKHLDQLSHSQIQSKNCNIKMLKYSCISLWLILGMRSDPSSKLAETCFEQVSPLHSCILAKLFQVHSEFLHEPEIRKVFLAFSSNPKYYLLFSGKNYEIIQKINTFTFDSLNNLLKKLLKMDKEEVELEKEVYIDFIIYNTDDAQNIHGSNNDIVSVIDLFLKIGLLYDNSDEIIIKASHEKNQKAERSMKLLTHQFLTTQLKALESTQEPSHLPWTIPNYCTLVRYFGKIKKLITNKECKILITWPVLQELDLDKNKRTECREIIRYLNGLVEASNPYIKVLDVHKEEFKVSCPYITYRRKLEVEHVNSVKYFYENVSKNVKIIVACTFDVDAAISEYDIIPETNLFKDI